MVIQHRGQITHLIVVFVFVLSTYVVISPYFVPIPDRDSGVFLYVGSRILHGEIPYRDVWDHKAPFIYYINALGLWLGHGSRWGAWLVEFLFFLGSAILGYFAIKRIFGKNVALLVSTLWLFYLPRALGNGNFVQVYGLFFQFGALYLWVSSIDKASLRKSFFLGLCLGVISLVQPNLISLPTVLFMSLMIRQVFSKTTIMSQAKLVVVGLAGIISVPLLTLGYFYSKGAFFDFWDSVFVYNFFYTQNGSVLDRISSLSQGAKLMEPLVFFAFLGWVWTLGSLTSDGELRFEKITMAILLPADLLASAASPKFLAHYYISWMPSLALLSGCFFSNHLKVFTAQRRETSAYAVKFRVYGVVAFLLAISLLAKSQFFFDIGKQVGTGQIIVDISKSPKYEYAAYIINNTEESEQVYFWGNEVALNFLTRRSSPSKYIYTYPLFIPEEYGTTSMATQFTQDIISAKPLIVDTRNDFIPSIDELSTSQYPELHKFITFFESNYEWVGAIGPSQWQVYKYIGP